MHLIVSTRQFLIALILGLPVLISAQIEFTSSNIPIVVIDTDSQEIADKYRIVAHMGIIQNGQGMRNQLTDPFNEYSGRINIEIRGSTSQSYPKKSYGFETQDELGENRNVSLIGLPKENDWILYAPYSDKTLLRNIFTYRLSRKLGQYAPRTKLCELILNGAYQGVYVLIEKIKRDQNRVDISRLEPEATGGDDLTGGYILKIDKSTGNSGPTWQSEFGGIKFLYEYPEYDEIASEQKTYIKNYIDDFEQALVADDYADPDMGYRKYMDEMSFVDFFLINELSKNVDGYALSTFLYKDRDSLGGKLNMGPVWDFNLAFGNADYRDAYLTSGLQLSMNDNPWWWDILLQDSTFTDHILEKWSDIREKQYSDDQIISIIDSLASLLAESQERNFVKWDVLGLQIWPNYYVGLSYEDELEFLKQWTLERLNWLDDSLSYAIEIHKSQYLFPNGIDQIPQKLETKVYPNPFSAFFYYEFALNRPGDISLSLYDLKGAQVSTIVNETYYPAGSHSISYQRPEIPGSIYVLILKIDGEIVSVQKIVKM